MDKYNCQYCGVKLPDRASWEHHLDTCYSRTTVCTLCGTRMPTAHKDQHLKVIHGLISGSGGGGGGAREDNNSHNNQMLTHHLSNSKDPKTAKIARKLQLANDHAAVFPIESSMTRMRAMNKSSTLSRMMMKSNDNNYNHRSTTPIATSYSSYSPTNQNTPGFSFRSQDESVILERARRSRTPNNHAKISDLKAQNGIAIVEDVVQKIMTRGGQLQRRQEEEEQETNKNRNNNHLSLLQAASDYQTSKSRYTYPSFQQEQLRNTPTSIRYYHHHQHQNLNQEMSACPDCGKVILSMDKHKCDVESTECPKCGDIVPLLSFDRHFLECAVGPSWQATREKREMDRMVLRNAASFRSMRSTLKSATTAGNLLAEPRTTSASRETSQQREHVLMNNDQNQQQQLPKSRSVSFSKKVENNPSHGLDEFGTLERSIGSFSQQTPTHAKDGNTSSSKNNNNNTGNSFSRSKSPSVNLTTTSLPPGEVKKPGMRNYQGTWNDWQVNKDLKLSVDELLPEVSPENHHNHENYQMTNLELFKQARLGASNPHQRYKFTLFDRNKKDDDRNVKKTNEQNRKEYYGQEEEEEKDPVGYRSCVLCNKLIPESLISQHLDQCDQNLLSCPLCKQGVPQHQVEDHKIICEANRRRCPFCSTSIQFARLADHVSKCCEDQGQLGNGKMTMYHGTTEKSAREIVSKGFLPSASGLLGEGVYMTRDITKAKNYGPVIIEALVLIPGKILTVAKTGHRMQKTWQFNGYDAAWIPQGVSKSDGLEEHCIKNPQHIAVVRIIRD